jgi:hypothetical protein
MIKTLKELGIRGLYLNIIQGWMEEMKVSEYGWMAYIYMK